MFSSTAWKSKRRIRVEDRDVGRWFNTAVGLQRRRKKEELTEQILHLQGKKYSRAIWIADRRKGINPQG